MNHPGIRKNDDGSLTFCCSKKDCPSIKFHDDGSATITENEHSVLFTAEQLALLGQTIMLSTWKGAIRQ
jgi:hypothetical protein